MVSIVNLFSQAFRAPVLHFLFIGGLLFIVNLEWKSRTLNNTGKPYSEELVITARQIEQFRSDLTAQLGLPPTPQQLQGAIESAIHDELLYREALALGLDKNNPAIRRRLVQIARFVEEDPDQDEDTLYKLSLKLGLSRSDLVVRRHLVTQMRLVVERVPLGKEQPIPTDTELEKFIHQHPKKIMVPQSIRLTHVYLSMDRRGISTETDARRILKELQSESIGPLDAPRIGDPFLLGLHIPWTSHRRLEQLFGSEFANSVMELPIGVWSGPIKSSYGWHIVWIHEKQKDKLPTLEAVRDQVINDVLIERREKRLRETLNELRAKYSIRIEYPPD